jgi:hypothetical protein
MRDHDGLDRRLADWMRETASAPLSEGRFERTIAASTAGRPLPRWRAGFGSDWVDPSPSGLGTLTWPRRRTWPAVLIVLALLVAATIAGALLAGAQRASPSMWRLGGLAYAADGDIYVANADGSSPVRIADGDVTGRGPAYSAPRWSPDGSYLLYGIDGSLVEVADAAGRQLASFSGEAPTWAPDSSRIATLSFDSPADQVPHSLDVHAVDGRLLESVAIPDFPAGFGELAWSPDGTAIVALPWLVPLDGSPPRPFTGEVAAPGSDAAFSPDGSQVAIVATYGLYLVSPDGTGSRLLAPLPPPRQSDGYANPVWSPDGDRIAVWTRGVGDRSGAGLEVIDVATADAHTILPVTQPGPGIPRWSPDGSRLLALVPRSGGTYALVSQSADGSGSETILVDALARAGPSGGDWRWVRTMTPGPTPTGTLASPAPTPTAQLLAKESPVRLVSWPANQPASDALSPGAYALLKPDGARADYTAVVLTLPDGWAFADGLLSKSPKGLDRIAIDAAPVSSVYPDPCHWEQVAAQPFSHHHAHDGTIVIDTPALLGQRDTGVPPVEVLVAGQRGPGSLGGTGAVVLRTSVPPDLDIASCDGGDYRRWKTDGGDGSQIPQPPALSGQSDIVYFVDVDREALLVRGSAGPAASANDLASLEAILASMVVVR